MNRVVDWLAVKLVGATMAEIQAMKADIQLADQKVTKYYRQYIAVEEANVKLGGIIKDREKDIRTLSYRASKAERAYKAASERLSPVANENAELRAENEKIKWTLDAVKRGVLVSRISYPETETWAEPIYELVPRDQLEGVK